jgi:hypothetical protein
MGAQTEVANDSVWLLQAISVDVAVGACVGARHAALHALVKQIREHRVTDPEFIQIRFFVWLAAGLVIYFSCGPVQATWQRYR